MFRLFILSFCMIPLLAVAGDPPSPRPRAGARQTDSRNITRDAAIHRGVASFSRSASESAALVLEPVTRNAPAGFFSNASNITIPLERAERPECQFTFGNEVPGMQNVIKECSDSTSNNSYCDCVERNLLKFVGARKLHEDRLKAAKNLEKLSADFVVAKWVREYAGNLKVAAGMKQYTGSRGEFLGSLCSPNLIAGDIMAQPPTNCDAEQYKTFQDSFIKAAGATPGRGNNKEAIEKFLTSSVSASMERVNDGSIYTCLDESEFNLLMYFGKPDSSAIASFLQTKSFSDLRDQKILELDSRLNNFTQFLDRNEAMFIESPKRLNPTAFQGRDRVETDLADFFEMLPFAKVLMHEYTSEKTLNPDGTTFTLHSSEKKKANYQKLRALIKDITQFSQEMKSTKANHADSLKNGYELMGRFNERLKDKLSAINAENKDGLSNLTSDRCTEMSEQLINLACVKPVMNRPAYIAQILGRESKYGMPSASECTMAAINGGEQLYNCQVAESAGCAYRSPARDPGQSNGAPQSPSFIKEMFLSKDALKEQKIYVSERNRLVAHFCRDYSTWVDTKSPCARLKGREKDTCMISGQGSRSEFIKTAPSSHLAQLENIRERVNESTNGAATAGFSRGEQVSESMESTSYRKRYQEVAVALGSSLENMGASSAMSPSVEEGGFLQAFSQMTQGAAAQITNQAGGAQAASQMNLAPFINPEAFKREVAQKDEEIKEKEEEIVQRITEKQTAPVAEQSGLSSQIASLQADLKRLKDERNELERQQQKIAATEAEVAGSGNSPAAVTSSKRTRVPASVVTPDDEDVRSSGFSTGTTGGTVGAAASSTAAASAGFNTSESFGGSLGAARSGTVQGLNAALLAANEAKSLVISGQSVPTTNVVSLEIANVKDTAGLEQLISSQKDRLQFNSEGWATVEVIDQATKSTIYMQVRLDNSKLVVTQLPKADQQVIRTQVREWTASYKNFIDRLKKTKRDTAGVTE